MKQKILLIVLIIILVVVLGLGFVFIQNNGDDIVDSESEENYTKTNNINGIVTNIWIDESKFDNLMNHKIKYLFVDVGDTNSYGYLKTTNQELVSFLNKVESFERENNYNFILLPYSEVNTYNYNIDSNFEDNFIKEYFDLDRIGFDGIFIDIEPVLDENSYLKLLERINKEFSDDSIIAVYSGSVGLKNSDNVWTWDLDFFKQVSEKVDLISVQGYDSGLTNKDEYQAYVKKQLVELSKSNLNTKLMLGVPTHRDYPETIENSLSVYKKTKSNFLGVVMFAEWTMDEKEWDVFDGYFL